MINNETLLLRLDRILNSEDGYGEEFETVVGLRKDAGELLDLLKSNICPYPGLTTLPTTIHNSE